MEFKAWLLTESSNGVLLMKATDAAGADAIARVGFKAQASHSSASKEFSKHNERTSEQNYGPGLYFSLVPNEGFARSNCARYLDWGDHIVLASIAPSARGLVTASLPENHPAWSLSPSGYSGVYDQFEALGVLGLFPGYDRGNTHTEPEWGYKLAGKVDLWVHEHNMIPHVVVYNPSVLRLVTQFKCERPEARPAVPSARRAPEPQAENPIMARWRRAAATPPKQPTRNQAQDDELSLERM
jgi:hypothetical protein